MVKQLCERKTLISNGEVLPFFLSVCQLPKPLRILFICHYAYILISKMFYLISQIPQISVLILISKIFCLISQIFQISVRQSITKTPQPLRIMSICYYACILISEMFIWYLRSLILSWSLRFSVAKATLESQMSVCQSVRHKNPSASQNQV